MPGLSAAIRFVPLHEPGSGVAVVLNVVSPSLSPEIVKEFKVLKSVAVESFSVFILVIAPLGTAGHPMLPDISNTSSMLAAGEMPELEVVKDVIHGDPGQVA
jgi:hypothetical protein